METKVEDGLAERRDRNTKYFHACACQRQCRNRLEKIENGAGRLCITQEAIEQAFVEYYEKLFSTTGPNNVAECMDFIGCKVIADMNVQLEASFTAAEVHQALTQMAPFKAPGRMAF